MASVRPGDPSIGIIHNSPALGEPALTITARLSGVQANRLNRNSDFAGGINSLRAPVPVETIAIVFLLRTAAIH